MFPNIDHLTANGKEFSLTLEMTMRESPQSYATFGHRPIYIRGEAATFIPHLSKAFIQGQYAIEADPDPHEMTLPFHFSILLKG